MSDYSFETDKDEWRKELTKGLRTTPDPTEDLPEVQLCRTSSQLFNSLT